MDRPASMGPRSFNRGNGQLVERRERWLLPLQWGRGLSTAEIMPIAQIGGKQWSGFNGAAVFQPRKCRIPSRPSRAIKPLQWGRGLSTAEMFAGGAESPDVVQLQWGRGLSTAEIGFTEYGYIGGAVASMGPRSFNRGNAPRNRGRSSPERLQWGRGLSTAEIDAAVDVNHAVALLQWGRGLSTAEMARARGSWVRLMCFNGAAVFQPRKFPSYAGTCAVTIHASMGPRSFNRGNQGGRCRRVEREVASMGPRSFNRGNSGVNLRSSPG